MVGCAAGYVEASRQPAEPSWQGRPAGYWLARVGTTNNLRALQAFHDIGTNGYSVLIAAFEGKESSFRRALRRIYTKLPEEIQRHVSPPIDPGILRWAAEIVLRRSSLEFVPPLLKEPNPDLHRIGLDILTDQTGPLKPDQVRLLVSFCHDTDPGIRYSAVLCLSQVGPSAAGALPALVPLRADPDAGVKNRAVETMWRIILVQTNASVPVLKSMLHQSNDEYSRRWAAVYLGDIGQKDPLVIATLIELLTNTDWEIRASACPALSEFVPAAVAAVPALRDALNDPNAFVRLGAKLALQKIEPKRAASVPQK
jgi:HEAT repeat protein